MTEGQIFAKRSTIKERRCLRVVSREGPELVIWGLANRKHRRNPYLCSHERSRFTANKTNIRRPSQLAISVYV